MKADIWRQYHVEWMKCFGDTNCLGIHFVYLIIKYFYWNIYCYNRLINCLWTSIVTHRIFLIHPVNYSATCRMIKNVLIKLYTNNSHVYSNWPLIASIIYMYSLIHLCTSNIVYLPSIIIDRQELVIILGPVLAFTHIFSQLGEREFASSYAKCFLSILFK